MNSPHANSPDASHTTPIVTHQIWKFQLALKPELTLEIPAPADVLSVQIQGGQVCLWARVNPQAEKEQVKLFLVPSGQDMPSSSGLIHHTTIVPSAGPVLHVFRDYR